MIVVSAPTIEDSPLEHARSRFSRRMFDRFELRIEAFLEAERGQLPLWFVAAFAGGIAMWLWLPGARQWAAFIVLMLGVTLAGLAWGRGRFGRAMVVGGLALAAGSGLIWLRSTLVAAPRLVRAAIMTLDARVERVE